MAKVIQMGRKHCEKGEIARYEQFLLFPQCFQKSCFPGASKGVIVWEWVNPLPYAKILAQYKLKAFADDIFTVAYMEQFSLIGKKNYEKKKKVLFAGSFSFSQCFHLASLKVGIIR